MAFIKVTEVKKQKETFPIFLLLYENINEEENQELAVELSEKVNKQTEVMNEAWGGLPVWA